MAPQAALSEVLNPGLDDLLVGQVHLQGLG